MIKLKKQVLYSEAEAMGGKSQQLNKYEERMKRKNSRYFG